MYHKNSVVLKELSFVSITSTHAKKVLQKLSFDSITLKHAKKKGLQVKVHKISHKIQTYFDNLLINSVHMIDNYIEKTLKTLQTICLLSCDFTILSMDLHQLSFNNRSKKNSQNNIQKVEPYLNFFFIFMLVNDILDISKTMLRA